MIKKLPLLSDVPEVPRFDSAFIAPTEEQVCSQLVPANHIDIGFMRPVDASRAFPPFYPDVPDLDGLICRTGSKDRGFGRTPLDVFDRRGVSGEGL